MPPGRDRIVAGTCDDDRPMDALTEDPAPPPTGTGTTWGPDGGGAEAAPSTSRAARLLGVGVRRVAAVPLEGWITFGVVLAACGFVFAQLHPSFLLTDSTPAGGDMGAHVWGPAYLRDSLLPAGRWSGWTPDWYAGFPAYHFYMVTPSVAIALLSYVVPYGVAFKLVTVSGVVTIPLSGYLFGRLSGLRFPGPAICAVGAMVFLFDRSFSIYGGNIPSTLAGEFAFSMSLSLAIVYLGMVSASLRTGRYRGWAALLLALTGLTHLIPAFWALAATGVLVLVHWCRGRDLWVPVAGAAAGAAGAWMVATSESSIVRTAIGGALVALAGAALGWMLWRARPAWRWPITVLPVAGLLSAFWVLPFFLQRGYMNDMGWEKKVGDALADLLFLRSELDPQLVDHPGIRWLVVGAVGGLALSLFTRNRTGVFLGCSAVLSGLAFWLLPEGRLWNARLLPFYYLSLYLLVAVGVAELGRVLSTLLAPDERHPLRTVRLATPVLAALAGWVVVGLPLHVLPGGEERVDGFHWLLWDTVGEPKSFIGSWAAWNYEGYEDTDGDNPKAWPEHRDVVATMAAVGEELGCGRAMWEHEDQHNRYGTPMALMLLPFWTDGCIGSMEGLYFEASATTPYHFLNQDQLSSSPSNAQRDLPYGAGVPTEADFDLGVAHLQLMGVRYYMAISGRMQAFATAHPSLTEVAASGPWKVYEVADSELVVPLENEPAVIEGIEPVAHPWLDASVRWYQDRTAWPVPLAADGPESWQRVTCRFEESDDPVVRIGAEGTCEQPEARPVDGPVVVSDVVEGDDSISFEVDRTGVPMLVKASYFPNWTVTGAEGPYRVTPNLMVVIPTSERVELRYGRTTADWLGMGLTLVGLVWLVVLFRARPLVPADPDGTSGSRPHPTRRGGGRDAGGRRGYLAEAMGVAEPTPDGPEPEPEPATDHGPSAPGSPEPAPPWVAGRRSVPADQFDPTSLILGGLSDRSGPTGPGGDGHVPPTASDDDPPGGPPARS